MDVLFANWHYLSFNDSGWGWNMLRGLASTVEIAFGAYAFALFIGVSGAMGKLNGALLTRWSLEVYTTLFRAVPDLVLILLVYYAGTSLLNEMLGSFGYRPVDVSGRVAGILVLGFTYGAYATEVFRGAILSVSRGQQEAGEAFGMTRWKILSRITFPAMLPLALPALSNLWLNVTKNTSLLAVVGFSELAMTTRQAAGATRAYFLFFMVAAMLYLSLTIISNVFFRALEARVSRGLPELD